MLVCLEISIVGVLRGLAALWGRGFTGQGPVPLPSIKVSRVGQVMVTRFNQESGSSGKFVVMRQVRGQAGTSVHGSDWGSGLMRVTGWETAQWQISQKYCGDRAGPSSGGQSVGWGLNRGTCGQAGGQLWLSWRPAVLQNSSERDWRSQGELNWVFRAQG